MNQESQKLPYEKPRLLELGDVVELTQAIGVKGMLDGIAVLKTS